MFAVPKTPANVGDSENLH